MKKIKVEPYNPKWTHAFNELKTAYFEHINSDLRIEHIGSTAIPGLSAKPIIDIDIVVKTKGEVLSLIVALEELGYIHQGNLGVEGREAFKRSLTDVPLLYEHHSKWFQHHLYVCLEDSLAFRNHIALKAYLMENDEAVKEYSALKEALAHQYPHDTDSYCRGKTPIITRILRACDFTEAEIENIVTANA